MIKSILNLIFITNRGRGPIPWLRPIINLRTRLLDGPKGKRALALLTISVFLYYKLFTAYEFLWAKIHSLIHLGELEKVWSLIYFDSFVLIFIVSGLAFLVCLRCGRPDDEKRPFFIPFLQGRPWSATILVTAFFAPLLVFAPTVIADLFIAFDPAEGRIFSLEHLLPHTGYIPYALALALTIGILCGDVAAKPGALHWWTLGTLFITYEQFSGAPILWWSAFCAFFPSKAHVPVRFLAALAVCAAPLLAFFSSQKIVQQYPLYHPDYYQNQISNRPAYQAVLLGDGNEMIFRHDFEAVRMQYEQGEWQVTDKVNIGFQWNKISPDFDDQVAYLLQCPQNRCSGFCVLDLSRMQLSRTAPHPDIRLHAHPDDLDQAYDPKEKRLYLARKNGAIGLFDVEHFNLVARAERAEKDGGRLLRIVFDQKRNRLLVLQTGRLTALSASDLTELDSVNFSTGAYGILLDPVRDHIWISLPEAMTIRVLDAGSLKTIEDLVAPAGVRFLAIIEESQLLVVTSITGVVELRELQGHRLITRTRTIPWIHWVTVLPRQKQLFITAGDVPPVIWSYQPPDLHLDPIGRFMMWCERIVRFLMLKQKENVTSLSYASGP